MFISIEGDASHPTLRYAAAELESLLLACTPARLAAPDQARYRFLIGLLPSPSEAQVYSLSAKTAPSGQTTVRLLGGSPSAALCAVYRCLEMLGFVFSINGYTLRAPVNFALCQTLNEVVRPLCRQRGVRQHINFPMDISSYHLADAKAYIRNLARMQLNSITFHSYTGQWHGYEDGSQRIFAGNYFYGQRHLVPPAPELAGKIDNRKYYCIPEIEGQLSDEAARDAFTKAWLRELMEVCREAGLHITFSVELPEDISQEVCLQMVRGVLADYPQIDAIEWLSPEGGGPATAPWRYEELTERLTGLFGKDILENGALPYLPAALPESLAGAAESLKRSVDLYRRRAEVFAGLEEKPIYIGLYVMCRETLKLLGRVMEKILPAEVVLTFLPAHGSLAAADNLAFMELKPETMQRTLVYSWLEFDGNMYLLQNGSDGIDRLADLCARAADGQSVFGACFNHWRTAENELTAAYMARRTLAPLSPDVFYGETAAQYGLGRPADFRAAMTLLAETDVFNRDKLFNIGFCFLGCWLFIHKGLGWIRGWAWEDMEASADSYGKIIALLENCLDDCTGPEGIGHLRFLINRAECSILQIRAIQSLSKIAAFARDEAPEALTEEEKALVLVHCAEADRYAADYLAKHCQLLPDRGCQGTAVSYWATIPVYIDHIRQYFAYGETECTHKPDSFDAPPPPDTACL